MKTREKCVCAEGEGSEGLTGTGIVAAQGQMRSSVVQQERQRKRERERKISICTVCIERERDAVIYDSAVGLWVLSCCTSVWDTSSAAVQQIHSLTSHQPHTHTHTHTHTPAASVPANTPHTLLHTQCSRSHMFQIQVMLMVLHQTSALTRLTSHYRKKSVYTHSYLNQTLKKS